MLAKVNNRKSVIPFGGGSSHFHYFTEEEINRITSRIQEWYDESKGKRRKYRGKYWLTFLVLRFTGARHGEVYLIDDEKDVDYRTSEVKLWTLKQRRKSQRIVPLPNQVVSEIARYLMEYPEMKGKIFKIHPANFRKWFAEMVVQAGVDKEKAHPHALRHTRAMEMIRAGIPLTIIQSMLGHANLNSTAVYLRFSNVEAKMLLKEKGLI